MVLTVDSISDIKKAPNVEFSEFKGESVVKSSKSKVLVETKELEGAKSEASPTTVRGKLINELFWALVSILSWEVIAADDWGEVTCNQTKVIN